MDADTLWDRLIRKAASDPWHRHCTEILSATEYEYGRLRRHLSPHQRYIIENYLTAIEKQDDCLIQLAYQLGKEQPN